MRQGVTLCYHNTSSAEITFYIGVIMKDLDKQFSLTMNNKHVRCTLLIILIFAVMLGDKRKREGAVLLSLLSSQSASGCSLICHFHFAVCCSKLKCSIKIE